MLVWKAMPSIELMMLAVFCEHSRMIRGAHEPLTVDKEGQLDDH
jgi:hypothetical protein